MTISPHPAHGNNRVPWTDEVRAQARVALRVAATSGSDDRTLGYYVRAALAHGLTVTEVCRAAHLARPRVMELSNPAVTG